MISPMNLDEHAEPKVSDDVMQAILDQLQLLVESHRRSERNLAIITRLLEILFQSNREIQDKSAAKKKAAE